MLAAAHPTSADMLPWHSGVDMSWDGAANDWGMADAGQVQWPLTSEIERLQLHIQEIEHWKYHAEESIRSFGKDCLEWQVAASHAAAMGLGGLDASPTAALSGTPTELAAWHCAGGLADTKPVTMPSAKAKATSPTALSQLPAPIRLPLGPEPGGPPRRSRESSPRSASSKLSNDAQGEVATPAPGKDEAFVLPPGLLLPPGMTLARAASLPTGVADDGTPEWITPAVSATAASTATSSGRLQHPPGLPANAEQTQSSAQQPGDLCSAGKLDLAICDTLAEVSPGIYRGPIEVAGESCIRAEWRIDSVRSKLQASMGRPLVSPPFAVRGLPNLRLMVLPDAREAVKNARNRERKSMYAAMVKKGPLHGSLKLKADCLESNTVLRFYLTVGFVRCGPFTYDFAECAIHGCDDFNTDWLKQVDDINGTLCVGVEILDEKVDPTSSIPLTVSSTAAPSETSSSSASGSKSLTAPTTELAEGRPPRGRRAQQHWRHRGC